MYKTKEEVIIIQAEAKEPIHTRAVFWSHDKGTAKMLFKLRKDGTSQSLAEGTIVPVVLDFNSDTAENGRGRHIYHAVIEDAVNGIVSIVLEDNILGYQGRVDGSIYIELPDSRSLDTAGRFTFHIKRSPIDEDVPELENYYWQGFSDIMEQYHESITEIKLEAKTLLDSLTADVNTAQNKVTQLEQSITTANTNLNTRIDEISKKIDANDVFTKAESSANVIDQVSGINKMQKTLLLDFKNKITGSTVQNPHTGRTQSSTNLLSPASGSWTYFDQAAYSQTKSLNNTLASTSTNVSSKIPQYFFSFNVLETLKRELGEEFFINQGATNVASQVALAKTIVTKTSRDVYGYGSCPSGNKLTSAVFSQQKNTWTNDESITSSAVAKINLTSTGSDIQNIISSDGMIYYIDYTDAADETTSSTINIDYTSLEITIDYSANSIIKSIIAQNHVTNLATQAEATTATDNTKTMTPLRTKQLLDAKLLNMVYPIGSIYMSVNSATPATLFGGTWERFSKGRVLVGVDESDTVLATSGKQGGSTNPLTTHTHVTQLTTYRVTSAGSGTVNNLARSTDQGNAATGEFDSVTSSGDNTDHKNWQPFTTVYMWKRTA